MNPADEREHVDQNSWWRTFRHAVACSMIVVSQAAGQATASRMELSCGVLTSTTSEADLVARFGKENVVRDSVVGSDDGPEPGTVLFPTRPEARAQVFWNDPETRLRPSAIQVGEGGTAWRTATGIVAGMTLRDLERMNGRLFRMSGFSREGGNGGSVISWSGGRLEPPFTSGCELHVQLQPVYDGSIDPIFSQVQSGPNYSSGHPALQRVNPRVVSLALSFPRPSADHARTPLGMSYLAAEFQHSRTVTRSEWVGHWVQVLNVNSQRFLTGRDGPDRILHDSAGIRDSASRAFYWKMEIRQRGQARLVAHSETSWMGTEELSLSVSRLGELTFSKDYGGDSGYPYKCRMPARDRFVCLFDKQPYGHGIEFRRVR